MIEKLKAWIANIILAINHYQQRRADYFILTHMTDKQLRDVGITRGEIKTRFFEV
jgi:uncharacterized protein YjiS (DUF1127 family)